MSSKVRIKAGPVEFEYEGEGDLSISDIKELFSHIDTLFKVPVLREHDTHHQQDDTNATSQMVQTPSNGLQLHVSSVARKLSVKTASDLVVAAAATLQVCEGKSSFTRTELLETMKRATGLYQKNMSGNLSKSVQTLLQSKLNQLGEGVYSLKAPVLEELGAALAQP